MSADVERIAAVLSRHFSDRDETQGCALRCGFDEDDRATHLAEQLAAAGIGDKAQAWDEGCARGQSSPANFTPTNPYRQGQS